MNGNVFLALAIELAHEGVEQETLFNIFSDIHETYDEYSHLVVDALDEISGYSSDPMFPNGLSWNELEERR